MGEKQGPSIEEYTQMFTQYMLQDAESSKVFSEFAKYIEEVNKDPNLKKIGGLKVKKSDGGFPYAVSKIIEDERGSPVAYVAMLTQKGVSLGPILVKPYLEALSKMKYTHMLDELEKTDNWKEYTARYSKKAS